MSSVEYQKIIKVDRTLKYLVVAYNDKLNVIDAISTESLHEAKQFKRIFFSKFKAKSVDIAILKESWVRMD